ncbi:hypothetical protein ACJJTC_014235 [Scirpophaga incertulas]
MSTLKSTYKRSSGNAFPQNKQMKFTTVSPDAIESCHRLGTKTNKQRPIIVRFSAMNHRVAVWRAKTALKGSGITISEFLTRMRQDVFREARKHFGIRKCWSSEGVIIISLEDKRRKIVSMAELLVLIAQYPQQGMKMKKAG